MQKEPVGSWIVRACADTFALSEPSACMQLAWNQEALTGDIALTAEELEEARSSLPDLGCCSLVKCRL